MKKPPHVSDRNSIFRNKEKKIASGQRRKGTHSFFQGASLWLTPSLKTKKYMNSSRYLPIIRSVVSIFNGYYRIQYLTVIIFLIFVIFSGKIFTPEGLLVILIALFYFIVYCLDKWLKNFDGY
jgi:hypothetical protein